MIIRKLFAFYKIIVEREIRRARFQWSSFLIMYRLEKEIKRSTHGGNVEARNLQRIRYTLTAGAMYIYQF